LTDGRERKALGLEFSNQVGQHLDRPLLELM